MSLKSGDIGVRAARSAPASSVMIPMIIIKMVITLFDVAAVNMVAGKVFSRIEYISTCLLHMGHK